MRFQVLKPDLLSIDETAGSSGYLLAPFVIAGTCSLLLQKILLK
jgi:hypothetical protein